MQIRNVTNRTLEVAVQSSKSSQTLWETPVQSNMTVSKDLPPGDAPYRLLGSWAANPPLNLNFVLPGAHTVPNNDAKVEITAVYPGFDATVSPH